MDHAVFVSYRRSDARHAAARIVEHLNAAWGVGRVLTDLELETGEDFAKAVDATLRLCSAMLVVIGPTWLEARDARGERRLDDPGDWVRCEIAAALQRGLPVVPVLVDGSPMPRPGTLPPDLEPLLTRNAISLSDERWGEDMRRLREVIERAVGVPAAPKALPAGAAHEVFISYAFEDEAWAQHVVAALEGAGRACWIASRDVVPGSASYAREITRAIKASRLMVVLLSAAANDSDDVLNEITLAKNHRVPRLPLRIDDTPLDDGFEYFFSQAQRLDTARLERPEALRRLLAAVDLQLGRPIAGAG